MAVNCKQLRSPDAIRLGWWKAGEAEMYMQMYWGGTRDRGIHADNIYGAGAVDAGGSTETKTIQFICPPSTAVKYRSIIIRKRKQHLY